MSKFCKALTNAVSFRIPGDTNVLTFNPCCLYNELIPFQPRTYQKYREKFISARNFLPECSKCELKEKTHKASLRTRTNGNIPDDIGDSIYKLEIVLDTTCNAACIQCGPMQSSLWRKEVNKRVYHIQPEQQIDTNIEKIRSVVDFSQLGEIHFWGGEPLITDTHLKILKDIPDPSKVSLAYTTNVSVFPNQEVLDLWSKFKRVRVGLSIDAVDDKIFYIRWPLAWDKIKRNLELFSTVVSSSIQIHINCCIIPVNVFYTKDIIDWFKTHYPNIPVNFIRGEYPLDISHTPQRLRDHVIKQLPPDHEVVNILKEVPIADHKEIITYLDEIDQRRKLNWRNTFPEIVEFFEQ